MEFVKEKQKTKVDLEIRREVEITSAKPEVKLLN